MTVMNAPHLHCTRFGKWRRAPLHCRAFKPIALTAHIFAEVPHVPPHSFLLNDFVTR